MERIVVYNSKTGFSEKYGKWIAQELACKAVSYKDMTPQHWKENDVIIYGAGIMAGRINGWDKVKKIPERCGKKLIVYAVGGAPMKADEVILTVKDNNLTKEEQKEIPFFYLEGGIDFEKMGFFPRTMLKTMYKMLKKKKDKTQEDMGMLRLFERSSDNSSKENIKPLIICAEQI
ncbi:flavodoxin domain-containing protein [Kineothrix sedimenti]|uniref:Flavodoxin domain-containing protein n=1 Tax=Kineothrix sedimenti TaxID=3123317 RepID=A0ABZ3F099_9FIRM